MTPTTASLLDARLTALQGTSALLTSRDSKSGSEWADLLRSFHATDHRCRMCGLDTVISDSKTALSAARLALLIPASMLDNVGGKMKRGYIVGNVTLFCNACNNARADYSAINGPFIVTSDMLQLPECVALSWPALKKNPGRDGQRIMNSRMVRARMGLPF